MILLAEEDTASPKNQSKVQFYSMLEKGFSLREILRELNLKLHDILPTGVFCCAAIAELDFRNCSLQYWNGGLPDCFLYRSSSSEIARLASNHLPLGILSNGKFSDRVEVLPIGVGDRLYFWSDGIHEAEDEAGEMFGE